MVTEILGGQDLRAFPMGKLAGMDNAAIDDLASRKDTLPNLPVNFARWNEPN